MTENYQVLARKYRPQTFSEVIGQEALIKTLTNSIVQNKIAHAFILTGIRGTGKTTTARLIAKSLNCVGKDGNGGETITPCLECPHCKAIAASIDQDVIEFDAASHTGVNDIRDIIETIHYAPVASRYKIYIIDEVHMLSNSAFNALLKTLEEPPAHVKFIFATTEIRKVPITILSRCLRFDLNRVSQEELEKNLKNICQKEGYQLEDGAASLIAYSAEGSVRDSLSLLDRVISYNNFAGTIAEDVVLNVLGFAGKEKIYNLYETLMEKNHNKAMEIFSELYLSMVSSDNFLGDLLNITHQLLMKKSKNLFTGNLSAFQKQWLEDNQNKITMAALFRIWQFLIRASGDIRNAANHKTFLEVLLLKICYGMDIPEIPDLIKKLQNNNSTANIVKDTSVTDKALKMFEGSKLS